MKQIKLIAAPIVMSISIFLSGTADAENLYNYSAFVTDCANSCAAIPSLNNGSTITGTITIATNPNGSFGDDDVLDIDLSVLDPGLPQNPPVGDPLIDNPMALSSDLGVVSSNGTAGTTDAENEINGGQILIELLVPPFIDGGWFIVIDLASGRGQMCVFYLVAGCIPGATEEVKFEGQFQFLGPDTDDDGIADAFDNCIVIPNPLQSNSNFDSIGNECDPDINDDCEVNFLDLGLLKAAFFSTIGDANWNFNADLTGDPSGRPDGVINFLDLALMKQFFFGPPGPSAMGCN